MQIINEAGKKYGRLTVIKYVGNNKYGRALWACECDCGNEKAVLGADLRSGKVRSCGCLEQENRVLMARKRALHTHHMSDTRLYGVWHGMKKRCNCENHPHFCDYGGRGISVCDEWENSFTTFAEWALSHGYDEHAPKGACTLDRIDVDGDYCPENCRFADMSVQQNNRRDSHDRVHEYIGDDEEMSEKENEECVFHIFRGDNFV